MISSFRVVLDTNTVLRGLVSTNSAAAAVMRMADMRKIIPLLSKPVLDEYRGVLVDKELLRRFPHLTPTVVNITLRRLRFVGDYIRSPQAGFEYARDPRDQKFIELAIALQGTHILTDDKDLLSLPHDKTEAGKRFRQRLREVEVLSAGHFLKLHGSALRPNIF